MGSKIPKLVKFVSILVISLFIMVGCSQSEASKRLDGKIFVKYLGDGPEELVFLDGNLTVKRKELLPPVVKNPQDYEKIEDQEYEDVDFKDRAAGEYIVEYEGEELFSFRMNEDDLLVEKDGATYIEKQRFNQYH